MAGVCNSNAILSGLIDYYCLVCEDLFQNVEDVHQHVDTPHHNKILQQTYYVNEYIEHRIRKLRKGYFCEYCNEAFTTSSKMRSHVNTETHVYRRNSKQFSSSRPVLNLSCSGNKVLTSQLLIDERPWNGILDDDTCLVCDEEIDSFEDHKKIWNHVLKLAQTKILVGKDELSRIINDSLYQCLICNIMCPINDYDTHNTTESHIRNHTKAIQFTPVSTADNGDVNQTSPNKNDCIDNIVNEKDSKPKTEEKQACVTEKPSKKTQNNQIQSSTYTKAIQFTPVSTAANGDVDQSSSNINEYEKEEGSVKIGNDTKVELNTEENNQNNKLVKQAGGVPDKEKEKPNTSKEQDVQTQILNGQVEDTTSFAKANNFIYIESVNTATCNICKVKVPFYLKNMKEHVNGVVHKNKMAESKNKMAEQNQSEKKQENKGKAKRSQESIKNEEIEEIKRFKTEMCEDFIDTIITATNQRTGVESLLINGHICINMASFAMITRAGNKPMCQLCYKIIPNSDPGFTRHLKSDIKINGVKTNHDDANRKVPVVKDLGDEFVREVRPERFHCGYCNIVVPGWEDLNLHLNTTVHIRMKMEARRKAELIRDADADDDNRTEMLRFIRLFHFFNMMRGF